MALTDKQKTRYERQLLLEDFNENTQEKLFNSSVLVIGAGGLGSPAILYLAGAGIGNLGIADYDVVNLSNLPRQIIHTQKDIEKEKTLCASEKISALNSGINIQTHNVKITFGNAKNIFKDYDFIIDATDNPESKFMINQVCVNLNKAFSHAGINSYEGQTTTVIPGKSPCLECLFKDMIPYLIENKPEKIPVFNTVPGVIGTIQATECIKYLCGIGDLLTGKLLTFDSKTTRFNSIHFNKNQECKVC